MSIETVGSADVDGPLSHEVVADHHGGSAPLRILMVTDFYAPYVGGVEQHVRSLAHALVDRGHHVAVATLRTPSASAARDRDGAVAVYRVPSLSQRAASGHQSADRPWAPPIPDPVASAALRRVVTEEQPDIVHGHDWLARSLWPRTLGGRPFVSTLHYYTRSCAKKTMWVDDAMCAGPSLRRCIPCASEHFGAVRGPLIATATRAGAAIERRSTTRTISVSAATAILNDGPTSRPVAVVPNLLAQAVPDAPGTVAVALPPGIPDEPFVLYVGDLRPVKGVEVLLAAYRELRDAPPLVLLGERHGRSVDDLPDGVTAPGPVPNSVVRELWQRCLFGVVPSVWAEPFGIVVIEAMAAGRTVVASDVGGIPEIVEHDRSGVLVPPGDPDALAEAIRRLVEDPDRRERLEREALARSVRYRADVVAAQVEQVYLAAAAAKVRG